MTLGEVAAATGGSLVGDDVDIDGVAFDSRLIEPTELFVPLVAERDGHDYIDPSMRAYLTAREPLGGNAVIVADTATALLDLGRHARSRLPDRVVGITGSVGKTTVKDLLGAVLTERFVTATSVRSFNNEIGVPYTLVNAPDDTAAVIAEMGARGIGHIALLCDVARPTVGVVTTVGMVHTELFGSVEDVARGKGELVESLPASGTAVLNADNELVAAMGERTSATVLTYGERRNDVDLTADDVVLDDELRPSFTLRSPWGDAAVRLSVRGPHQVSNALAAAAAALAADASLDDVVTGLGSAELSPWRMDVARARSGAMIVNDAYNANPMSMEVALRALKLVEANRRVAFLGTMAELGPAAAAAHREVAALARSLDVRVIAVGESLYGVEGVEDVDAALRLASTMGVGRGDVVLVKGSRVAGLERLAAELLQR